MLRYSRGGLSAGWPLNQCCLAAAPRPAVLQAAAAGCCKNRPRWLNRSVSPSPQPPAPAPQPHSVHRASVHRFPISCASFRLRAVTCLRTAQNRHVGPRRRFLDFANRQKQRHKQQADTGTQRQTVTDTDSVTHTRTRREDTWRNRHTDTGTGYSSNPSHRRGAAATLPPPLAGCENWWHRLVPSPKSQVPRQGGGTC